jgi:Lipid-droplet associated hydrolase
MSQPAASVTAGFLKSPMGVQQALHMAKDEMETVKEDLWDEDIWETRYSDDAKSSVPLVLYFGKQVSVLFFLTL